MTDVSPMPSQPKHRSFGKSCLYFGAMVVLIGLAAYYLYFGPKAAGDNYVNAMRYVDEDEMLNASCPGSELHENLRQGWIDFDMTREGGFRIAIEKAKFTPIENTMTIDYRVITWRGFGPSPTELSVHEVLHIKPQGLYKFCLYEGEISTR